MPHPTHHLFLSYSRKDNHPKVDGGEGWITAFYRRLQTQHKAYTGRELKVFFDTEAIDHGGDWKGRLGQGLRTSRLFLAFLSPNYMRSPNCRWEWEEYLRREHSLARGEDGIRTIFFEIVPGMPGVEAGSVQAIEAELRADQEIARWLDMITEELSRRNAYLDPQEKHAAAGGLHPKAAFDLRPWFSLGPHVLAELDAAERLEQLRQNPKLDTHNIVTLADRLQQMDQHITTRLDRCLLADFAPGVRSLGRSYPHFVGRHRELRQLHDSLVNDKIGIVTAVHGLGGQGKTALAIQYAHAYADFYAAGGRWVIPCEGVTSMAEAMMRLAAQVELRFEVPPAYQDKDRPDVTVQFVLHLLEQFMRKNATDLFSKLRGDRDRMSRDEHLPEIEPRTLIILDNVDQPELLSADQVALLPQSEWFELVVTTRLDPERFGIGKELRPIPVDSLPIADAVALVRDFQPNQQFVDVEDEAGARRLCEILGGFTLSVELAAAYLGEHPYVRPGDYCDLLLQNGLPTSDDVAEEQSVASQIRHREKQLAVVADWTLARLDERARMVLEHASFLEPDSIMMDWLREIAGQRYPELQDTEMKRGKPNAWLEVWRQLRGLRLLTPCDEPKKTILERTLETQGVVPAVARIHRLIATHVKAKLSSEATEACLRALTQLIHCRAAAFQESWRHTARDHWMVRPFGDNALYLAREHCSSQELAVTCGIIGQAEMTLGALARAEQLLHQCSNNLKSQFEFDMENEEIGRVYSVSLGDLGEFCITRGQSGDAERALTLFEESLKIRKQIYEASPNSAQAVRDLSVSYERLGDYYFTRGQSGDAERALTLFEGALTIAQQIYKANANLVQAARDLSVSLMKLGDFYFTRGQSGDAERALTKFEESRRILKQICEASPNSAQAARDLSVSLNKLGDFYLDRDQLGDAERALTQFEKSLKIRKQIYEGNPNSAQAARDLSVSLNKLGDFFLDRDQLDDAERALTRFEESLKIRKQIYEGNPNSAQAGRDLSVSLNTLGDFYLVRAQSGDAQRALTQFEESHRILNQIYDANPNSAQAARDLMISLQRLSDITSTSSGSDSPTRALELQVIALQLALKLHQANPASASIGHDAAGSAIRTSQKADAVENKELAWHARRMCHSVLHTLIQNGCELKPSMAELYQQLHAIFGDQSQKDET